MLLCNFRSQRNYKGEYTPGTAGGPGGRDQTLAVKSRKIARKKVGQKQKTERKERKNRPNDGNNNGQATHGARKTPGPILFWRCFFLVWVNGDWGCWLGEKKGFLFWVKNKL